MRYLMVFVVFMASCTHPIPTLHTPGYAIPVQIHPDVQIAQSVILDAIDNQVQSWIQQKAIHGLAGYSDLELMAIARSKLIAVVGGGLGSVGEVITITWEEIPTELAFFLTWTVRYG